MVVLFVTDIVICWKGCCLYVRENDYILGRMIVCLREWLYVEENGCVLEVSLGRKVVYEDGYTYVHC
jgi:hypothetical protein